jgi:hypothetical protein
MDRSELKKEIAMVRWELKMEKLMDRSELKKEIAIVRWELKMEK